MKAWLNELWKKLKVFIGTDGVLHFLFCYLIVVTFGLIDWIPGVIVAFAVSVFKECWDYSYKNKGSAWDWKHTLHDLLCDFVGIGLGVLICLLAR
jgi:hypothetical protein